MGLAKHAAQCGRAIKQILPTRSFAQHTGQRSAPTGHLMFTLHPQTFPQVFTGSSVSAKSLAGSTDSLRSTRLEKNAEARDQQFKALGLQGLYGWRTIVLTIVDTNGNLNELP